MFGSTWHHLDAFADVVPNYADWICALLNEINVSAVALITVLLA
ncbi:hypothetical protein [Mycobacterium uberis]|nr:hypothetical protein [Mycobacterium uberis]